MQVAASNSCTIIYLSICLFIICFLGHVMNQSVTQKQERKAREGKDQEVISASHFLISYPVS